MFQPCTSVSALLIRLGDIPQKIDHQSNAKFRDGLGRIPRSITDRDAPLFCLRDRDVIDTSKSHVNEF